METTFSASMSRPGIRFIQDRELGLQHQHLQDFVALFFAAGKAFVDAARQKRFAHLHELHLLA